ncbi:GNAT family N-acetyltransferase [Acidobacteria bacterium AB60]|nr:GNAT family N-acetyltransferase [Acidobacteria bacterium AB60]
MTPGVSLEILDLRHFTAPLLRPLLETEGDVWQERLHWDYRTSARLLMQYLDSRMLPGYAAVDAGRVTGYAFCVYEETKAVIGDVFAVPPDVPNGVRPGRERTQSALEIEMTLLRHLFETLQNSPHVDRVESQLLLHPSGAHAGAFRRAGFQVYRRLFMVQSLAGVPLSPPIALPPQLEIRPWRDDDLNAAGKLISEAYAEHPDSIINDQYRSAHGSLRFLHNIVRYSGCGVFSPQVSHIILERSSREIVALVLGSRVSNISGHITQLCVKPSHRGQGLGRMLLDVAAAGFARQGLSEVSLTVTEANSRAIELYRSEGYEIRHTFDAAVWRRDAGY